VKQVRLNKARPPAEKHKVYEQKMQALDNIEAARDMELEIVYLDEICFTKSSIHRKAWSNVG
jgi:thymidine kinase